jgi:hypothetical protein
VEHASVTTLAELSIPAIFIIPPRATATSSAMPGHHRCSGLALRLGRGGQQQAGPRDASVLRLLLPDSPVYPSDMPFRVSAGSQRLSTRPACSSIAPRGPVQHVSSIHHSSKQPLLCLGPLAPLQSTKLPTYRELQPQPQASGPQPSSPSTMRTIRHSARVLSHVKPALLALSTRTTL